MAAGGAGVPGMQVTFVFDMQLNRCEAVLEALPQTPFAVACVIHGW